MIGKPYLLAIIDDDEGIRDLFFEYFSDKEDVKPLKFGNPIHALEMIRSNDIKIVLTDAMMPEMTGDEVVAECRKMEQGINVMVVTGTEDLNLAERCLRLGARRVLEKPPRMAEVDEAVSECIRHLEMWNNLIRNLPPGKMIV